MHKFRFILPVALLFALLYSCSSPNNTEQIGPVKIIRYEQDLFNIDNNNLKQGLLELKAKYPIFLGGDLDDTLNMIQLAEYINDPMIRKFYSDCMAKYPSMEWLEEDMGELQSKYIEQFEGTKPFPVFTYVSGLDYSHAIVFLDSMMLISLDMYLGPVYQDYDKLGIPRYISRRFQQDNIIRDAAESMLETHNSPTKENTIIAEMLEGGKILYGIETLLPKAKKAIIANYTEEQMKWCFDNEKELWAFLVKNELLFSSDPKYKQQLLMEGPSTPEFMDNAPARLGEFAGWQIIKSYHKKNPQITLQQIFDNQDYNEILRDSGYKP